MVVRRAETGAHVGRAPHAECYAVLGYGGNGITFSGWTPELRN